MMTIPEIFPFGKDRVHLNQNKKYINAKHNQIETLKLVVSNSKFGKGCFADATIEKGETICFLEGEETTWEKYEKKYRQGLVRLDDPLQISETSYLELHKPYIYFNHSCNPNSGLRGKNQLIAIKKIMPDEEIFFDYSSVSWDERLTKDYGAWTMKCECGERNCRKIIGNFPTISKSQRRRYLRLKIVPDFILEKLKRKENIYNI